MVVHSFLQIDLRFSWLIVQVEQLLRISRKTVITIFITIPSSAEAWAFKQAGFAAMSLLLAATANGVGSHAMEGFDARRVLTAIGAPTDGRWGVPVIISLGYTRTTGHPSETLASARPKQHEMVYRNKWKR
jgi:nitroreductase